MEQIKEFELPRYERHTGNTITILRIESNETPVAVTKTGGDLGRVILVYKKSNQIVLTPFCVHQNDVILGRLSEVKQKIALWHDDIKKKGMKRTEWAEIFRFLARNLKFQKVIHKQYLFKDYLKETIELSDPYLSLLSLLQKEGIPIDKEEKILLLSH
jgi:hypothetical protein